MQILKKGSKGDAVKILQEALGISPADGIFGIGTENAVKQFQYSKGLAADGIVGAGTWKALGITDNVSKCVDSMVTYSPIHTHITACSNRSIKYIVIHFTAGSSSKKGAALNNRNVFLKRAASADFVVDDANILQINPDIKNNYCWAVGDKASKTERGASLAGKASNSNVVSIEVCSSLKAGYSAAYANHEGWFFTDAALDNARKLTRVLMNKYNIPLERVVRHYDVSGKLCPGIVGWNTGNIYTNSGKRTATRNNEEEWLKFKKSL